MFNGCINLRYLNIYNFNDNSLVSWNNIFYSIQKNFIICINDINNELNKKKILSELSKLQCLIYDCSYDWEKNKKRIIYNNGTCIDDCKNDEINKYEFDFFCYKECPKGTHLSKKNKYKCEKNKDKCLNQFPYIILSNYTCAENCNSEDFFSGKCELNQEHIKKKGLISSNIINEIENGVIDKLIWKVIHDKKDIVIKKNETIYQITTSFNENNNYYENLSSIKLGECEKVLKEKYEISSNIPLIIYKIEEKEEEFLIPLIEYEIFNSKTNEKLNLNICENLNISISIPVFINETILYKYNPNNNYYNDICNTSISEYGTDMTLYDRKNEYNNNNYFLCLVNCAYFNYNLDNKKVICQCKAENGIYFDKTKLLNKLKLIKKKTNLEVMKCFKLLFSKELIKNTINYIILFIIFLHILSGVYFYTKEYNSFFHQIDELLNLKKILEVEKKSKINKINENSFELISSSKKNDSQNKSDNNSQSNFKFKFSSEMNFRKEKFKNNKSKNNETMEIPLSGQYEINNISYKIALEIDKRSYFQFYISLLKENYILIFTFNPKNDYNSYTIKFGLFLFLFALNIFINALFFNDTTLHKIYEDKGFFNIIYFIPIIIYSSIICSIINIIMKKIYLSQNNILSIKYEQNMNILNAKLINIVKCLIVKFICFFSINLAILLFFWYYLSCYSIVYKNTQLYFLKEISISFSFLLFFPFILYLFVPLVSILDTRKDFKKYNMDGDINVENILKFVEKWEKNELKRQLKSEKIPKINKGNVYIIVGKSFEKEVINNDKDVMLLFYAPWCTHCKELSPKYEEVGIKLKDKNPKLLIAKIDGSLNEIENISISGFPTIMFFPGNQKDKKPIEYKGRRTTEDIIQFIKKNAYNKIIDEEIKEENENSEKDNIKEEKRRKSNL